MQHLPLPKWMGICRMWLFVWGNWAYAQSRVAKVNSGHFNALFGYFCVGSFIVCPHLRGRPHSVCFASRMAAQVSQGSKELRMLPPFIWPCLALSLCRNYEGDKAAPCLHYDTQGSMDTDTKPRREWHVNGRPAAIVVGQLSALPLPINI